MLPVADIKPTSTWGSFNVYQFKAKNMRLLSSIASSKWRIFSTWVGLYLISTERNPSEENYCVLP